MLRKESLLSFTHDVFVCVCVGVGVCAGIFLYVNCRKDGKVLVCVICKCIKSRADLVCVRGFSNPDKQPPLWRTRCAVFLLCCSRNVCYDTALKRMPVQFQHSLRNLLCSL